MLINKLILKILININNNKPIKVNIKKWTKI